MGGMDGRKTSKAYHSWSTTFKPVFFLNIKPLTKIKWVNPIRNFLFFVSSRSNGIIKWVVLQESLVSLLVQIKKTFTRVGPNFEARIPLTGKPNENKSINGGTFATSVKIGAGLRLTAQKMWWPIRRLSFINSFHYYQSHTRRGRPTSREMKWF